MTRSRRLLSFSQVLAVLPGKVRLGGDGRHVIVFGEAFGFIVDYSPDKALRCNLSGEPLEVLPRLTGLERSYYQGGRRISPQPPQPLTRPRLKAAGKWLRREPNNRMAQSRIKCRQIGYPDPKPATRPPNRGRSNPRVAVSTM